MDKETKTGGQTTKSGDGTSSAGATGGRSWPQSPKGEVTLQDYRVRTDCGDYMITADKVTFLEEGTLVLEKHGFANGFAPGHWKSVQVWKEGFGDK